MKKKYFVLNALLFIFTFSSQAQLLEPNAYLLGDYVNIGISGNGHEIAPCPAHLSANCRGTDSYIGFVANPAMDGWDQFNGDYVTRGVLECGFGLTYTLGGTTYTKSNNKAGYSNDIAGDITTYYENDDSIHVIWNGVVDDLEIRIRYDLKRDEHFYTTSIRLKNIGIETYSNIYYYHNIDPDGNQALGWGYSTTNSIVSQSSILNDSAIVKSTQNIDWEVPCILSASGTAWKAYYGGFMNRNGYEMWNGLVGKTISEGSVYSGDVAIGLAYKIESFAPSEVSECFKFATSFKEDLVFSETVDCGELGDDDGGGGDDDTDGLNENKEFNINIYPNPTNNSQITIDIDGAFLYTISDIKGSLVRKGNGNNLTLIELDNLEKGIYFIKIEQNNQAVKEKILIK